MWNVMTDDIEIYWEITTSSAQVWKLRLIDFALGWIVSQLLWWIPKLNQPRSHPMIYDSKMFLLPGFFIEDFISAPSPQNLGSLLGMSPRLPHPHVIGRSWRDRLKGKTKFNRNHKLQTTQLKIVGKIPKRELKMLKVRSHSNKWELVASIFQIRSIYIDKNQLLKIKTPYSFILQALGWEPSAPQFGHSIDSSQSNSSCKWPKKATWVMRFDNVYSRVCTKDFPMICKSSLKMPI